jgi:hypothetical protein
MGLAMAAPQVMATKSDAFARGELFVFCCYQFLTRAAGCALQCIHDNESDRQIALEPIPTT